MTSLLFEIMCCGHTGQQLRKPRRKRRAQLCLKAERRWVQGRAHRQQPWIMIPPPAPLAATRESESVHQKSPPCFAFSMQCLPTLSTEPAPSLTFLNLLVFCAWRIPQWIMLFGQWYARFPWAHTVEEPVGAEPFAGLCWTMFRSCYFILAALGPPAQLQLLPEGLGTCPSPAPSPSQSLAEILHPQATCCHSGEASLPHSHDT